MVCISVTSCLRISLSLSLSLFYSSHCIRCLLLYHSQPITFLSLFHSLFLPFPFPLFPPFIAHCLLNPSTVQFYFCSANSICSYLHTLSFTTKMTSSSYTSPSSLDLSLDSSISSLSTQSRSLQSSNVFSQNNSIDVNCTNSFTSLPFSAHSQIIHGWQKLVKSTYHCVTSSYYTNTAIFNEKALILTIGESNYFCPRSQWSYMEKLSFPCFIYPTEKSMLNSLSKFASWRVLYFPNLKDIVNFEYNFMENLYHTCPSCSNHYTQCSLLESCIQTFYQGKEDKFQARVCAHARFQFLESKELYNLFRANSRTISSLAPPSSPASKKRKKTLAE